MNRPFTDPGNTDQPMTMNTIQVTQSFPWPGKLGFGEDQARYLAFAEALDADELAVQLEARVKDIYHQLAFVDGALGIMRETRDLLRNFRDVSSGLFAVGTGLQQDVLQAQVAVASMTEDITVTEQNRVALAARFNALLGRAPTIPVGLAVLGEIDALLPSVEELMATAGDMRPALRAAAGRVAAASAGLQAARRAVYPDVTVTFGYAHRPQFVDLSTLMVGIRVPLFAGSRYAPLRREMAAREEEAEARARDLYNETYARLAELRAEAERARSLSVLYAGSILPQARAAVESALSSYRVGQVDYMTLVNNELTVNRYEIESLRLRAEYLQAVARIDALVGAGTEERS